MIVKGIIMNGLRRKAELLKSDLRPLCGRDFKKTGLYHNLWVILG